MCDYSLHSVKSRPAKVGDKLTTRDFGTGTRGFAASETAMFRHINKDRAAAHHGALEFPDGQIALLTFLCEGQQATVLQLPAEPKTAIVSEAQRRVAHAG